MPNLQKLHLEDNNLGSLGEDEIRVFAEAIGNLPNLQTLDLAANNLGSLSEAGIIAFVEGIAKLPNLQKLYLGNNNLGSLSEAGITAFVDGLAKLPNLRKLELWDDNLGSLGEAGIIAFAEGIAKLPNLHTLDLEDNEFTLEQARILATKLVKSKTLHTLTPSEVVDVTEFFIKEIIMSGDEGHIKLVLDKAPKDHVAKMIELISPEESIATAGAGSPGGSSTGATISVQKELILKLYPFVLVAAEKHGLQSLLPSLKIFNGVSAAGSGVGAWADSAEQGKEGEADDGSTTQAFVYGANPAAAGSGVLATGSGLDKHDKKRKDLGEVGANKRIRAGNHPEDEADEGAVASASAGDGADEAPPTAAHVGYSDLDLAGIVADISG